MVDSTDITERITLWLQQKSLGSGLQTIYEGCFKLPANRYLRLWTEGGYSDSGVDGDCKIGIRNMTDAVDLRNISVLNSGTLNRGRPIQSWSYSLDKLISIFWQKTVDPAHVISGFFVVSMDSA